jgi:riboflavin kinase/FMN adenylyltransferase
LQRAGAAHRFVVEAMQTVMVGGERASSSAIRTLLAQGDMAHAARLLGRPYSIAGRVVHGNRLGHQLGFPTANIQLKRIRLALAGIFAVTVECIDTAPLPGVASLGLRPTVEGDGRYHLEVHLFDFDRDLYDAHLRVNFLHKLRDEVKYDSLEALTAQIARDCQDARDFLNRMS